MRTIARLFLLATLVVAGVFAQWGASYADHDDVCVEVDVVGLLANHHPEPVCRPYNDDVACTDPNGGVNPWVWAYVHVCYPEP